VYVLRRIKVFALLHQLAKAPSKKADPPASTDPNKKYFGTVTFLAVISDKGYVCSAEVLRGLNKELNKKTVKAVQGRHFDPWQKNGRAVPVVVSLDVVALVANLRTGSVMGTFGLVVLPLVRFPLSCLLYAGHRMGSK
jgi:hypothetical protein